MTYRRRIDKRKLLPWLLPVVAMLVIAPLTPWLDLLVSGYFFHEGAFYQHPLLDWVYLYGIYPAWITAGIATTMLALSHLHGPWQRWRQPALFLTLTLALGGGIITNAILKDHWGRPRPKQIVEFGGDQPYHPFYSPDFSPSETPRKSFPSGHAVMGFYFFALIRLGRRLNSKALTTTGVILTVTLGGLLSFTRIAQGGHFLSDVMISALVMWLTTLAIEWLIFAAAIPGNKRLCSQTLHFES